MSNHTRAQILRTRFLRRLLTPIDRWCYRLFHAEHEARQRERLFAQVRQEAERIWAERPPQECPVHHIPLVCERVMFPQARHAIEGWICPFWDHHVVALPAYPDIEAQTDPMHALSAQRPLHIFNQQRQAGAGVNTAMQAAIPKEQK